MALENDGISLTPKVYPRFGLAVKLLEIGRSHLGEWFENPRSHFGL
jgi:hypothetical protein